MEKDKDNGQSGPDLGPLFQRQGDPRGLKTALSSTKHGQKECLKSDSALRLDFFSALTRYKKHANAANYARDATRSARLAIIELQRAKKSEEFEKERNGESIENIFGISWSEFIR